MAQANRLVPFFYDFYVIIFEFMGFPCTIYWNFCIEFGLFIMNRLLNYRPVLFCC